MPTNRDEPRELMAKLIRVWRGSASTRVLQKQASQVRPAREAVRRVAPTGRILTLRNKRSERYAESLVGTGRHRSRLLAAMPFSKADLAVLQQRMNMAAVYQPPLMSPRRTGDRDRQRADDGHASVERRHRHHVER